MVDNGHLVDATAIKLVIVYSVRLWLLFTKWTPKQLATEPNFYSKIIFRDEVYNPKNGYVSKKNCKFWIITLASQDYDLASHFTGGTNSLKSTPNR